MARTRMTAAGTGKRAILGWAVALAVLAVPTGTANADSAAGSSRFTAQAQRLGLSETQAETLQRRVDFYLAKRGGTQIEINRIRIEAGHDLVVPLPGEKKVRNITAGTETLNSGAPIPCDLGHFCLYEGPSYTGSMDDMYHCREYKEPFGTPNGSWRNNQTGGARAQFKDVDHITRWTSGPNPDHDLEADLRWVWWIQPC